jgi:hypothetical protein
MPDLELVQGESLPVTAQTRYAEIASNVYAETVALGSQDSVTGAAATIDYPHHEIHSGSTFLSSYKSAEGADIADNATITFTITVRARYPHMVFRAACGGDMEAELLEGPTVTAGTGNATTVFNKNRGSTRTPTVGVRRDMTVTDAGTLIEHELAPGGTGGNSIGGASQQRPEWILNINTVYLFRITNRAGNAQPMSIAIEWYEESSN